VQQTRLLGELISRPHGVMHLWVMLTPLSFVLIILFAIDATHTAPSGADDVMPGCWAA